MDKLRVLQPVLQSGLSAARQWLRGMVDPSSNRLFYEYQPQAKRRVHKHSPVRDLGTAADLATLQAFTGGSEFDAVIAATLDHYRPMLVHETTPEGEEGVATAEGLGGTETEAELGDAPLPWCYSDPAKLGEPSSIAHNTFMLLGLATWERYPHEAEKERLLAELVNGIVHQQRSDGTLKVYFAPADLPDHGWQLYAGEAMLGLGTAYVRLGDERLWQSASSAITAYQTKYEQGQVDSNELVFFSNWMSQAGRILAQQTTDHQQKAAVSTFLHSMQDAIAGRTFFTAVQEAPGSMATVEVACELEALADTFALTLDDGDAERQTRYAEHITTLVGFLDKAQVKAGPDVPPEAVGGFGHSVKLSTQRIDVTGHVVSAYIKLLAMLGEE